MVRKDFVKRVADKLHDNNIRKPVSSPRQAFHISDDNGNKKDFIVKQTEKTVMYTIPDVENILDAIIEVIAETLKSGDTINIRKLGIFGLKYRRGRSTKLPNDDHVYAVESRYVPKFTSGSELRMAAKAYQLLREEQEVDEPLPLFDDEGDI